MSSEQRKSSYVGAPAYFELELACQVICDAFDSFGCYLVGSALDRPDWRDVDVRMIVEDDKFVKLFPRARSAAENLWPFDTRWLLLNASIALWLSRRTGLPVDFQIQPQSHANDVHKGRRQPLGVLRADRFVNAEQEAEG